MVMPSSVKPTNSQDAPMPPQGDEIKQDKDAAAAAAAAGKKSDGNVEMGDAGAAPAAAGAARKSDSQFGFTGKDAKIDAKPLDDDEEYSKDDINSKSNNDEDEDDGDEDDDEDDDGDVDGDVEDEGLPTYLMPDGSLELNEEDQMMISAMRASGADEAQMS